MSKQPTGPLSGLKIVDLTSMISGPMATAILADQGAEVIKVEPPSGDQLRYMGPPHNGVAACFFTCNRNKKSVCLDLKSDPGREALKALLQEADVFVQNFRPGAIERMGFGEEVVRKINHNIVYVSISGFGEEGPYANQRVYDPVIQALSGMTDIQADKATKRPKMVQFVIADKVTALSAAQAITAALLERERSGVAQSIKLSMIDSMIGFHWPEAMVGLTYEEAEFDASAAGGTTDQVFETRDGKYVTCSAISDSEWAAVCLSIDKPEWVDDERFRTIARRTKNGEVRKRLTGEEISKFDREDLLKRFAEEGAPAGPLLSRVELLANEQIVANGTVETLSFEGFGSVRQAAPPARFSKTPSNIRTAAPTLGQHTEQVLSSIGFMQS